MKQEESARERGSHEQERLLISSVFLSPKSIVGMSELASHPISHKTDTIFCTSIWHVYLHNLHTSHTMPGL